MSDFEKAAPQAGDTSQRQRLAAARKPSTAQSRVQRGVPTETLPNETRLRFPPIAQTRIRRSGTGVIRRTIDDTTWQRQIRPVLSQKRTVTVREGTVEKVLYLEGKTLYLQSGSEKVKIASKEALADLRKDHEFVPEDLPEHVTKKATDALTVSPGTGFKVSEFAAEPLSLVHHTANDDGSNAHLTMENAHVLALHDATSTLGDVSSKVGQDKATINKRLGDDYSIPSIDNLNFYPGQKPKGAKKKSGGDPLHEEMSLQRYLKFIVSAFDQCGIPGDYGKRMMAMAQEMAKKKSLDLTTLYMRVGMDESSFIRAALAIDARLKTSGASVLELDESVRAPFARWWTTEGNDSAVPYLRDLSTAGRPDSAGPPPLAERAWVREGTTAQSGTTYSSLDTAYTKLHAPAFITAVNKWTDEQPDPL